MKIFAERVPTQFVGAMCAYPNGDGTWVLELRLDETTIRQALYLERDDGLVLLLTEDVPG